MLNSKERGTIESDNSSGYETVKSRWETTQKSLPVEVYLQWLEQRGSALTQHRNEHIRTGQFSFAHCKFDTFFKVSMKDECGGRCDGACTLTPSLHGVECAFVKVP